MITTGPIYRTTRGILVGTLAIAFAMAACSDEGSEGTDPSALDTGTLAFYANGESFIRDGFLSKDGWRIDFDHFFVNITGATALQATAEETDEAAGTGEGLIAHGGHPHSGVSEAGVHVALEGDHLVDLRRTPLLPEGEPRTRIDVVTDVDALGNRVLSGNYNTVAFNLQPVGRNWALPSCVAPVTPADALAMAGHSIRMTGTAVKGGEIVGFDIRLLPVLDRLRPNDSGIAFSSCLWVSDDDPDPGLVTPGGIGWVELTFHSDHIFGDGADPDPELNDFAPGFEPFAAVAEADPCCPYDRCVEATQEQLRSRWADAASEDPDLGYVYGLLVYTLGTTGHSGEGHCLH